MRLLAIRPRGVRELETGLRDKGFAESAAAAVRLAQRGVRDVLLFEFKADLNAYLAERGHPSIHTLADVIARCAALKARCVEADELAGEPRGLRSAGPPPAVGSLLRGTLATIAQYTRGVRNQVVITPAVDQEAVDYAFPLTKDPNDRTQELRFSGGTKF